MARRSIIVASQKNASGRPADRVLARLALLLSFVLAMALATLPPAAASPADHYTGPYFGEDNFPPGCVRDMSRENPDNICHHMRTGLNALDSPKIDVLVLVPVSPTAERDMRIMRQSIEMWEGGISYLADEMGLDWLQEGTEFHIVVDYVDETGFGSSEFTTYPAWDPEIVVIASNPVGGVGIGIDPVWFAEALGLSDGEGPCHGIQNPFDFEEWSQLPGFDNHHEGRTGTYVEDCDGAGGNVCFAINGAIDPEPGTIDFFNLYDLVSHEVGHCLTLGHVGDGAEGEWGVVPTNDIMAYDADPPGLNKCVSTLDVEAFAVRMSNYLDVNADGVVDENDRLLTNDQIGEGGNPFQVQHPLDHFYASSTGSPLDCPQPDLGPLPGERTDWTPEPDRATPVLSVTSPADGAELKHGDITVAGTVERTYETGGTGTSDGTAGSLRVESATPAAAEDEEVYFEHPGGNTFQVTDSTLGEHTATNHFFTLDIEQPSDVAFQLTWTDEVSSNDLDLYITGAATGSGTSSTPGEEVLLSNVTGTLDIRVDPWMVSDPAGTTYTLKAIITPTAGGGDPGDPALYPATEQIAVYVDDVLAGSQDVRTRRDSDTFAIPATLQAGTHVLRVEWTDRGSVIASETVTVTVKGAKKPRRQ
jgi:hypothetical protein